MRHLSFLVMLFLCFSPVIATDLPSPVPVALNPSENQNPITLVMKANNIETTPTLLSGPVVNGEYWKDVPLDLQYWFFQTNLDNLDPAEYWSWHDENNKVVAYEIKGTTTKSCGFITTVPLAAPSMPSNDAYGYVYFPIAPACPYYVPQHQFPSFRLRVFSYDFNRGVLTRYLSTSPNNPTIPPLYEWGIYSVGFNLDENFKNWGIGISLDILSLSPDDNPDVSYFLGQPVVVWVY